jgi:hypothetical protein
MGVEPMIVGAAIFALGALGGRFLPVRRRGPKAIQPECGCEHHRSFHEGGTGKCHYLEGKAIRFTGGDPTAWEKVACGCQKYTGPEPLPEYYAPEIGG